MQVKYRSFTPALNPRRTKLEVPGWGGERQPRKDGSMEQAWHCLPFSEGARYGIELFYPYENELRVSTTAGSLRLRASSGRRPKGMAANGRRSAHSAISITPTSCRSISRSRKAGRFVSSRTRASTPTRPTRPRSRSRRSSAAGGRWSFSWSSNRRPREERIFSDSASRSRRSLSCPRRRRSTSSRCPTRRPPSANCSRGASFRAASTLSAETEWTSATNTVFDGTYRHILGAASEKAKQRR